MVNLPGNADPPGDPVHLRASDLDREQVAEVLRQAAGDGRLTPDEGGMYEGGTGEGGTDGGGMYEGGTGESGTDGV